MLKREGGTTLEEIMSAMGWLKHTTRAMLSAGGSAAIQPGPGTPLGVQRNSVGWIANQ